MARSSSAAVATPVAVEMPNHLDRRIGRETWT
jgi:hypothetical protein